MNRAGLPSPADRPTALLLPGDRLDAGALRHAAGGSVGVQLLAAERARYADSPSSPGPSTSTRRRWPRAPASRY